MGASDMRQVINAVFARGGSSNAVIFHERDLPVDKRLWEPLFRHVMGSPDPYGRQLNGMGGGISSLSKASLSPHRHAMMQMLITHLCR